MDFKKIIFVVLTAVSLNAFGLMPPSDDARVAYSCQINYRDERAPGSLELATQTSGVFSGMAVMYFDRLDWTLTVSTNASLEDRIRGGMIVLSAFQLESGNINAQAKLYNPTLDAGGIYIKSEDLEQAEISPGGTAEFSVRSQVFYGTSSTVGRGRLGVSVWATCQLTPN